MLSCRLLLSHLLLLYQRLLLRGVDSSWRCTTSHGASFQWLFLGSLLGCSQWWANFGTLLQSWWTLLPNVLARCNLGSYIINVCLVHLSYIRVHFLVLLIVFLEFLRAWSRHLSLFDDWVLSLHCLWGMLLHLHPLILSWAGIPAWNTWNISLARYSKTLLYWLTLIIFYLLSDLCLQLLTKWWIIIQGNCHNVINLFHR